MRYVNNYAFNAQPIASANSAALNANQWIALSCMGFFSVTDAAGTLKLQYSNDPANSNLNSSTFVPTNWADVPGATATATVSSGATVTLYVPVNFVARYYRLSWTRTGGTGTFTVTYEALYT